MAHLFPRSARADTGSLEAAAAQFWANYYSALEKSHVGLGRHLTVPIKDRNLITTSSEHVSVLEEYWRDELARQLGVTRSEVGPRVIKFKPHRKKSFDVCYPLKGDPKILISVKSMQNAYRNLTNRVEEALGDSAVLRVYSSKAVFGFFFFILDGSVARGSAEQGNKLVENGKKKGLSPFLTLVEDGGDFFDLGDVAKFRRAAGVKPSKPSERQDTIENAALSLLDLVASDHKADPSIHYDAMGFAPMVMNRVAGKDLKSADGWKPSLSPVAPLLDPNTMIARLVAAAKTRRLIV